jgi:predicted nucleotidyltransferase
MRLQHPLEIVTPTLDGDVLGVLAGADEWFAVQTINGLIPGRSDEGIRRTLKRLVSVGIVEELAVSRAHLYRLNREHLGAEPILQLATLKQTFFARLNASMSEWDINPMYACIFGSAARELMTDESDIDLFVIKPDSGPPSHWDAQVDALTVRASLWIGAEVRPLLYTESEIRRLGKAEPVFEFIASEGIQVFGDRQSFLNLLTE